MKDHKSQTKFLRICDNCFSYDRKGKHCQDRYTILPDKTRIPMKRKCTDQGCKVFMFA